MLMEVKYCLVCQEKLIGRSDKKFCGSQCRTTHHNAHRPLHEQTMKQINSDLRRNRSLMAQFCPGGKTTVEKSILLKLGYKFELFTHVFPFSKGTYFFCYDYGFLPIVEKGIEKMLIVQKQSYMNKLHFHPWDIEIIKNKK